jgi:arginyl-tRNA synthetase
MAEAKLKKLLLEALKKCCCEGAFEIDEEFEIEILVPGIQAHGDFSTNAALIIAARCGKNPRDVANILSGHIDCNDPLIKKVSVAGPGFINFIINKECYLEVLHEIASAGERFGHVDIGKGGKLQVEFVSANPTGPLHIGHGRGAVYGDVLANVMSAVGYEVTREYYVNDAGNQIKTLGRSVFLRLKEISGKSIEFPENCYRGAYISEIAGELKSAFCEKIATMSEEEAIDFCGEYAGNKILSDIKRDLAETGVKHDLYFHENLLHTDAAVENVINFLRHKGHVYDEEGAIWFKSTAFGDDKDRVLRKADGSLTYFAADIAYHKNKFDRGFGRVIDIWGADHGGYVTRMKASVGAMGYNPENFDVVLIQLVNLVRDGHAVSMSTRSATYETLEDVRNEVGKDVCRYFFLMRSHNAQLDFDLELAKKETPDNPVFYIQYAHARISSVFRKAAELGYVLKDGERPDVSRLVLPEEMRIAGYLGLLPSVITECAKELEPHKLAFYLLELARIFQSYYSQGKKDERYRVLQDDRELAISKLYLLKNIQIVIRNSLKILGISAPETMERQGMDV